MGAKWMAVLTFAWVSHPRGHPQLRSGALPRLHRPARPFLPLSRRRPRPCARPLRPRLTRSLPACPALADHHHLLQALEVGAAQVAPHHRRRHQLRGAGCAPAAAQVPPPAAAAAAAAGASAGMTRRGRWAADVQRMGRHRGP